MEKEFCKQLEQREKENEHLRIGIVGSGSILRETINIINHISGVRLCAICDSGIKNSGRIVASYDNSKVYDNADSLSKINELINSNIVAVTNNALDIPESNVDIILDFSTNLKFGSLLAVKSIFCKKHFITNPIIDIAVGNELHQLAKENNVFYSGAEGIESNSIINLYKYVKIHGFKVIAIGEVNEYFNKFSTPNTIRQASKYPEFNINQITSFSDGTMQSIAMGIVSNTTGLTPDIQGMHCPICSPKTILSTLKSKSDNGILYKEGVVEIVKCKQVTNGVFVVAKKSTNQITDDLMYIKRVEDDSYLFYRPYHYSLYETIIGIIKNIILGLPSDYHNYGQLTDVATYSKRNSCKGEYLDCIGGNTFYGRLGLLKCLECKKYLPLALADETRLKRDIGISELITLDDVEVDENSILYKLKYKKFNKACLIA